MASAWWRIPSLIDLGEILVDAERLIEVLAQLGDEGLREGAIDQRAGEIDRDDERNHRREDDGECQAALRSTEDRHGLRF